MVSLVNNTFSLAFGGSGSSGNGTLNSRTVTTTGNITSTDNIVYVNGSAPVSLTPVSPAAGQFLLIKDTSGAAHTNPITFIGTVDGVVNPVIGADYGGAVLSYNGTTWSQHA